MNKVDQLNVGDFITVACTYLGETRYVADKVTAVTEAGGIHTRRVFKISNGVCILKTPEGYGMAVPFGELGLMISANVTAVRRQKGEKVQRHRIGQPGVAA